MRLADDVYTWYMLVSFKMSVEVVWCLSWQ